MGFKARRALERGGIDATLVVREVVGEDDYGDDIFEVDYTKEVKILIDRKRRPTDDQEPTGNEIGTNPDIEIYIDEDEPVSDEPPQSLIRAEGVEYKVVRAGNRGGGVLVCESTRQRRVT